MQKYLSLVKLLFVQQYRVKPQQGKRKKGGTIAAYVILGVVFLPMLVGLAISMYFLGQVTQNVDNAANITSMLIFISQGVVLLFGIPTLISNVFSSKDADKLLFLPMRSSTIFAAKLTVVYLNEVITTAVMLVATLLPFGMGLSAGPAYFLLLIFALVLIPLLPMLVGSIVAIPLSALIAKVGRNGAVKTLLQIVLFVAIMAVYMVGMYELGLWGGDVSEEVGGGADEAQILLDKLANLGQFAKYVHSNYTLAQALIGATFGAVVLNLLISVAENALLFGLVLLMSLPFYHWMLSSSVEGEGGSGRRKKAGRDDLQVKNQGVVKELIFTDVKRVIRDSQMGFQCIMSLIVLPLMVGIFAFAFGMSSDEDINLMEMLRSEPLYQAIAPIVFVGYMSMLGMTSNVLGIYPISRENKSIYIIKSLPIGFNKYLLAKVILATVAMLISDTVTCILTVVLFGIEWYYGILMLATMALLGFGAMCITTLIDLKSPKLGWTNFNQSLKNAKNSWLAMLVGLVCMLALAVVATACIVGYWFTSGGWYMLMIMWIFILGLSAGFAAISYRMMTGKAQQHFENIEP